MPVSGYVLYDFLPVEEMLNVAEAVVRVFHRFGDYEHRQRNRLKFTVKALGWDGFRARFEEELAEFKAEGGAPLTLTADALRSEEAPDWTPATAPTLDAVRQAGDHAGQRPRHHAGHGEAAAAAGHLRPLDAQQRQPPEAGRLLPCDRAAAARRLHGRADARARRSRRSLRRRHDAAHRRAERALPLGEGGIGRAVLSAAGRGRSRRARRAHAERRRQLPRCRELPSGGDAVARAGPGAHRASQRPSRSRRHGAVGQHQDQRLPERLRPASHRLDWIPGQRPEGRDRAGAAVFRARRRRLLGRRVSRTSARSCRRCRCTG